LRVPFQTAYGGDGDAYIVKIESVSLASGGSTRCSTSPIWGLGCRRRQCHPGGRSANGARGGHDQFHEFSGDAADPAGDQWRRERRVRGADLDHVGRYGDNPAWRLRDLSGWQRKRRRHGSRVRPLRQHVCAGSTKSQNFRCPAGHFDAFQSTLIGTQNAFVSRIGAVSSLLVQTATGSPQPSPALRLEYRRIYFQHHQHWADTATNIIFYGTVATPNSDLASPPTGKVDTGSGSCNRKKETLSNASFRHCRRVRWPAWRST